MTLLRDHAAALDAADPLAPLRDQFTLPAGMIYLDGNSLGVCPSHAGTRGAGGPDGVAQGLIGSWNDAGWMHLPQRVGDKIAALVGPAPASWWWPTHLGQPVQVLSAALRIQPKMLPPPGDRSERSNPTDLYIAESWPKPGTARCAWSIRPSISPQRWTPTPRC